MTPAARISAAIACLDEILGGQAAERVLTNWARSSRFAGSKDRAAVRDHVFDALRKRRSLAHLGGAETGRALMIGALRDMGLDPATMFTGEGHAPPPMTDIEIAYTPGPMPPAIAADFPDWVYEQMQGDHGALADQVGQIQRSRAPVTIRVNLSRTARDAVQAELTADGIKTTPVAGCATALHVTENERRLKNSAAFLDGRVELQDLGAQELCHALPLQDGNRVLDYCAGGGGKILALADRAKISAFAHDADARRMADLPVRAARAGAKVTLVKDPAQHAHFDLVLCDVPCSGSGTWRRTPDAKWRFTPDRLVELTGIQQDILCQAAKLVRPGGVLAYATCSVFADENDAVITAFLDARPEWQRQYQNLRLPDQDGDGFFACILRLDDHS